MKTRAYYATRLSEHIAKTPEGFLVCKDVPIARTGWQDYLGSEIGAAESGLVKVHRDPKEVFDPACMASFESKPITDGHPASWVTPENINAYHRGHGRDIREGIKLPNGDRTLVADLVIMDSVLIDKITHGLREISCGYDCEYVSNGDGTYSQKLIRGNHIAVVKNGRAGDYVRIQDSKPYIKKEGHKVFNNRKKGSDILARIFSIGLKGFVADAEPEEVQEALEAVRKADGSEKDEFPEPKEKEREEPPKEEEAEDDISKLAKDLRGCKDAESRRKLFDCFMKGKDDEGGLEARLSKIEGQLSRLFNEEAGERGKDNDLISVETLKKKERPKNPIPGADGDFIEEKEEKEEKEGDGAKDAAVVSFLRSIKPLVAKTGDTALISSFNSLMRGSKGVDDSTYGKFLRLLKPESVKSAEDLVNRHMTNRGQDQAAKDAEWGASITDAYLGKHPGQVEAELKKAAKEGK